MARVIVEIFDHDDRRPTGEEDYAQIISAAQSMGCHVHTRTDTDRGGSPLTVAWMSTPYRQRFLGHFEITESGE